MKESSTKTTLRTNFDNSELEIYQKAIDIFKKQTGSERLYIKDKAYDRNCILLGWCSALHDKEDKDLSEFWIIFDNLTKAQNHETLETSKNYPKGQKQSKQQ